MATPKKVYDTYAYYHNECPQCGGSKNKYAKTCRTCKEARPIIVQPDDQTIRFIALTQGQKTVVLVEHYKWLAQWKWSALWNPDIQGYYAVRNLPRIDGKRSGFALMHRVILGLESGDVRQGDHINHDTLDNRLGFNLRIATPSQNSQNQRLRSDNISGVAGVSWDANRRKWHVSITVDKRVIHLGRFDSFELAVQVRREAVIQHHGNFACEGKQCQSFQIA